MTIDPDMLAMFSQTIFLAAPDTEDDRGNDTHGEAHEYLAFLQYATREFRTQTMESSVPRLLINIIPVEIIAGVKTFVGMSAFDSVNNQWQLTLPDGKHPPISNIDRAVGSDTLDHLIIFT
jgi:hypothetical protein